MSQVYHSFFQKYSTDGKIISLEDFQAFTIQQGDTALESDVATTFMRDFVRDPRRNVEAAYFTPKEVRNLRNFYTYNLLD